MACTVPFTLLLALGSGQSGCASTCACLALKPLPPFSVLHPPTHPAVRIGYPCFGQPRLVNGKIVGYSSWGRWRVHRWVPLQNVNTPGPSLCWLRAPAPSPHRPSSTDAGPLTTCGAGQRKCCLQRFSMQLTPPPPHTHPPFLQPLHLCVGAVAAVRRAAALPNQRGLPLLTPREAAPYAAVRQPRRVTGGRPLVVVTHP